MINWDVDYVDGFNIFCDLMQMEFEMLLMEYANICKMEKFYRHNEKCPDIFSVSPIHHTVYDWVALYQSVIAERVTVWALGEDIREQL